jgi:hypothetical protein
MTENDQAREENLEARPSRKMDPRTVSIILAFGIALVLLIVLNMN